MPGLFDTWPAVWAQNAPPAGGAGSPTLISYLPFVLVIGLYFYLILIRPPQQQEKRRRAMLGALKKNDKVLTSAGIYGTVVSIDDKDDRVVLRIDDDKGVRVAFSKGSIVRVVDPVADKSKEKAESV